VPIQYGELASVPPGVTFANRRALRTSGAHRPLQAGIDFAPGQAAASVVLSGVYPDDDHGDTVIYTGQGGLEPGTSRAIADQGFWRGNAALVRNRNLGIPVRLIRKIGGVFRYDGLFAVDDYFRERYASDGFLRLRYVLRSLSGSTPWVTRDQGGGPIRVEQTVLRIVRDTAVTRQVKRLYDFTCQMCRIVLPTPVLPYAEAAHIRPLGRPHFGRDALDNVLCLCPNDHVLFDWGAITVRPETLTITGEASLEGRRLLTVPVHRIDLMNFDYHQEAIFVPILERVDR
jgi:putative restriction endonuclease